MNQTRLRALAACFVVFASACGSDGGGGGGTGSDPVARVEVSAPASSLNVGATLQLTATARTASGGTVAGKAAQWTSSDERVARVNAAGLVDGLAAGAARITATVDGKVGSVDLTVVSPVASIVVTPDTATLAPGATRQLTAVARNAAGATVANVAFQWESSNTAVARVDAAGNVQAVAAGTATISAVAGSVRGSATIRVAAPTLSGLRFTNVWTGALHACAIDADGRAYCWGNRQSGQLGTGAAADCTVAVAGEAAPVACNTAPQPVAGDLRFRALALGTRGGQGHTCGITTAGKAYCWGSNSTGELGTGGEFDSRPTPAAVVGTQVFTSIVAGELHTCGLVADGTVYCWGDNTIGQGGTGGSPSKLLVPTQVATGIRFVSLSAGGTGTCGLTAEGKAWCWGNYANTVTSAPVAVSPDATFRSIAVGGSAFGGHVTCGIYTSGEAVCWGRAGTNAGLGNPSGTTRSETGVRVGGDSTFQAITNGNNLNCLIATGGAARCWGPNGEGEVGDGTTTLRSTPVAVQGPTFRSISSGWYNCGVGTDGFTYCWGRNDQGGLGAAAPDQCPVTNSPTIPCAKRPVRVRGQD